jgi:hypothetical protein
VIVSFGDVRCRDREARLVEDNEVRKNKRHIIGSLSMSFWHTQASGLLRNTYYTRLGVTHSLPHVSKTLNSSSRISLPSTILPL